MPPRSLDDTTMPGDTTSRPSAAAARRHSSSGSYDDSSRPAHRSSLPVSFNSKAVVILISTINEMSDRERDATCPTAEDMHRGQQTIVESILSLREGMEESVEDGICHRGLEHMKSPTTVETSRAAKMAVIDAVLHEQERQWDANIVDEAALARVAEAATRSARDAALSLAAADEVFARRYQKEEDVEEQEHDPAVRGVLGTALTVAPQQVTNSSPARGAAASGRPRRRASSTIPSLGGNPPSDASWAAPPVKSTLKKNKSVDAFLDRMTSHHNRQQRPRIVQSNGQPSY